jgi:methionyl-tRNA formyltransferase
MRLVFMGTPDFSLPALDALAAAGHDIAAAYTRPPRPAGRGKRLRPSPVQARAETLGLAVRHPAGLRDPAEHAAFAALQAEIAVVVAYGLILPRAILEAPEYGCLNLHASSLPRWRGAAPIQRAIMAGDRTTGINVMRMDEGLDTGPVCLSETVAIDDNDTAGRLHDRLAVLGADLMARALGALERGALACTPQPDEGVTYADKIDKSETRIDWTLPANEVQNRIRGLSPFPGAWCTIPDAAGNDRLKVLRTEPAEGSGDPGSILDDGLAVACGKGAVRLIEVQRAGRQAVSGAAFLNGLQTPLHHLS